MKSKSSEIPNSNDKIRQDLNDALVSQLLIKFIQQKKKHLNQLGVTIRGYEIGALTNGNIRLESIQPARIIPKIELRTYHMKTYTVVSSEDRSRTPLVKIHGIYLCLMGGLKMYAPLVRESSNQK